MTNARLKQAAHLLRDVQSKLRGNVDASVIQKLQEVIDELEKEELNPRQVARAEQNALRVLGEVVKLLPAIQRLLEGLFG